MTCDLCGRQENVETYGVYPPEYKYGPSGLESTSWSVDSAHFFTQDYCDDCVAKARKKNVRHAALVFFMPTIGMMRLVKFANCSKQEMGDLMVAGLKAHERAPLEKHILWPYGAEGKVSLEAYLTREGAQKKLEKRARELQKHPELRGFR